MASNPSHVFDLHFECDAERQIIVCKRKARDAASEDGSDVTYTRDGPHPVLKWLSTANRKRWLAALETMGWTHNA